MGRADSAELKVWQSSWTSRCQVVGGLHTVVTFHFAPHPLAPCRLTFQEATQIPLLRTLLSLKAGLRQGQTLGIPHLPELPSNPTFNGVLSVSTSLHPLSQDWELEHSDSVLFVFKFGGS